MKEQPAHADEEAVGVFEGAEQLTNVFRRRQQGRVRRRSKESVEEQDRPPPADGAGDDDGPVFGCGLPRRALP